MNNTVETFVFDQALLADEIYTFANQEGDFADAYYDHPIALALLLKAMARLSLGLKGFQKAQLQGLANRINLNLLAYQPLDISNLFNSFQWDADTESLKQIFFLYLPAAMVAGATMTQDELGIPIDFSTDDEMSHKFLQWHIPIIAASIINTTKERIANRIKRGIASGLSMQEITDSLTDVVDSSVRREMIVQTESIFANSEGGVIAGIELGADRKQWRTEIDPCFICFLLDFEETMILNPFSDGYYSPPHHPRCRCKLILSFSPSVDRSPERLAFLKKTYLYDLERRPYDTETGISYPDASSA